jgi:HEAT repeat protein
MKTASLVLLALGVLEAAALGGDAADRRVKDWIERLRSEPVAARRFLVHAIRDEANVYDGEPPRTTERPDLIPVLEVALGDEDEQVRSDAIGALKYMRHPLSFPVLVQALESKHGTVRYFACEGIGWLGDVGGLRSSVVAVLEKVRDRKDADESVPLVAARELVRLKAPTDPGIFYEALRDEAPCASLAANALVELGRKDAVEIMIKALRSARPSNDHWIGLALQKLTGQAIGNDRPKSADAEQWKSWLDANRSKLPEQTR